MPTDYDALAGDYDRRYADDRYGGVEETLLAFVGDDPRARVLEVGCGTGHWLALLAARGFAVAGVDASSAMLDRARMRLRSSVPAIRLEHRSADSLPFGDREFDRVFSINAIHHFEDADRYYREARRVLADRGGVLTIALDPNVGLDSWCVYDFFETTRARDLARYSPTARIREWMEAGGFGRCEMHVAQHVSIRMPASRALEDGLLDKSTTSQLADLSDEEYARGVDSIRVAINREASRGVVLEIVADLWLYATVGWLA